MRSSRESFGSAIVAVGFLVSLIVWAATTVHFFRNDNVVLGIVSLIVLPAEVVLPWLVSPQWGIASFAGTLACALGVLALDKSR